MSKSVSVRSCATREEAEFLKTLLESNGIRAVVMADEYPGLPLMVSGGVQLQVLEENAEQARASLALARTMLEPLVAEYANHPPFLRDFAVTLRELARLQMTTDEQGARADLQQSREILMQLWDENPDHPDYQSQLTETEQLLKNLDAQEGADPE